MGGQASESDSILHQKAGVEAARCQAVNRTSISSSTVLLSMDDRSSVDRTRGGAEHNRFTALGRGLVLRRRIASQKESACARDESSAAAPCAGGRNRWGQATGTRAHTLICLHRPLVRRPTCNDASPWRVRAWRNCPASNRPIPAFFSAPSAAAISNPEPFPLKTTFPETRKPCGSARTGPRPCRRSRALGSARCFGPRESTQGRGVGHPSLPGHPARPPPRRSRPRRAPACPQMPQHFAMHALAGRDRRHAPAPVEEGEGERRAECLRAPAAQGRGLGAARTRLRD